MQRAWADGEDSPTMTRGSLSMTERQAPRGTKMLSSMSKSRTSGLVGSSLRRGKMDLTVAASEENIDERRRVEGAGCVDGRGRDLRWHSGRQIENQLLAGWSIFGGWMSLDERKGTRTVVMVVCTGGRGEGNESSEKGRVMGAER